MRSCEVIMVTKNDVFIGINWSKANDFCSGSRLICFYHRSLLGVFIVSSLRKAACARRETFTNIRHDSTGYIDRVYWTKYKQLVVIIEMECNSNVILQTNITVMNFRNNSSTIECLVFIGITSYILVFHWYCIGT